MVDPKDMTPKQMFYAIQEDRMSFANFEVWLDEQTGDSWQSGYEIGCCDGYDEGYTDGSDS